jgi:hypothetical protein
MIEPNAKCVVNGKKLNELISWINGSMEQLDVVDPNNYASKRWFLISDANDINQGTEPEPSRDKMQREGGGQNNRDKLNKAAGEGQGVNISTGGALRDDGSTTRGGAKQVDAFGNVVGGSGALLDDGSTAADSRRRFLANKERASPSDIDFSKTDEFGNVIGLGGNGRTAQQPSGALLDDGSTAADSRRRFLANKERASPSGALRDDEGQTTAPPRVGATPPNATKKIPAKLRGGADRSEAIRRANRQRARMNRTSSLEMAMMDEATKKRQAEADKMALANKYR